MTIFYDKIALFSTETLILVSEIKDGWLLSKIFRLCRNRGMQVLISFHDSLLFCGRDQIHTGLKRSIFFLPLT